MKVLGLASGRVLRVMDARYKRDLASGHSHSRNTMIPDSSYNVSCPKALPGPPEQLSLLAKYLHIIPLSIAYCSTKQFKSDRHTEASSEFYPKFVRVHSQCRDKAVLKAHNCPGG